MKKVLIGVISCQQAPYGEMVETSLRTWDSVDVEGCETVYFFGNPQKQNTDKHVYFNIDESLFSMGFKDIEFFKWALKNREWDYLGRVNSSCWVHKQNLVDYCQTLPDKEVFAGLEVVPHGWVWGGGMFLISRDVIQLIVDNKSQWNHNEMEDMAMSKLVSRLGIKFTPGRACSIDAKGAGWQVMVYGHGAGYDFNNWSEFKLLQGQFWYRVKQDNLRHLEAGIMQELTNKL